MLSILQNPAENETLINTLSPKYFRKYTYCNVYRYNVSCTKVLYTLDNMYESTKVLSKVLSYLRRYFRTFVLSKVLSYQGTFVLSYFRTFVNSCILEGTKIDRIPSKVRKYFRKYFRKYESTF